MKNFLGILLVLIVVSCTESRVKKYQDLLEPKIGTVKKEEVTPLLGSPTKCAQESRYLKCEYRTASARNRPVSDIYSKQPGMGPDLTPYDQFDVLYLYYDALGVLREWEPVTVNP